MYCCLIFNTFILNSTFNWFNFSRAQFGALHNRELEDWLCSIDLPLKSNDSICIHWMRPNTILVTSSLVIFESQASVENGGNGHPPDVPRSDEKFILSLWIQIEPLRFKVYGGAETTAQEFTKRTMPGHVHIIFATACTINLWCLREKKKGKKKEKQVCFFEGIV